MEPTIELIDALEREEIIDARRQSFELKFLAGAELFDYACNISKSGIRGDNPNFNEEQVMNELRRRFELWDKLDRLLLTSVQDLI